MALHRRKQLDRPLWSVVEHEVEIPNLDLVICQGLWPRPNNNNAVAKEV
jgi:DNA mismatch repair protein MutH